MGTDPAYDIWNDPAIWGDMTSAEADATSAEADVTSSATNGAVMGSHVGPDDPQPSSPPTGGRKLGDVPDVYATPPPSNEPVPLSREDLDNGTFLEAVFGARVRFDHPTERWYLWHKGAHRWKLDDNRTIEEWVRNAATKRAAAASRSGDVAKVKIALALYSISKRDAALRDLRVHQGIAIGQKHWDQDRDVLGVRNGVLELRTGTFRPGDPLDNLTRQAPVLYDPTARCPRWEHFLSEVFVTPELVEYVRRVVGYVLTGQTTEQQWYLLYGTGSNGKTVFVSVLEALLGLHDYFEQAAQETFTLGKFGSSPNHNLAQFRSARLVVASEVSERASYDGSRIKAVTGGDPITAAAKYENNVTFVPQFKLMMLVNHLPTTKDDSIGFWRRLRPIPFDVTFDEHTADLGLTRALLAELPGILNWALSGAVDWYSSGLAPLPQLAAQLRDEYRAESDPLAMFVHECIVETGLAADQVPSREMYRIYLTWCQQNRKQSINETNFGRSPLMKAIGLGKKSTNTGNVYFGVKAYEPGAHVVKMPPRQISPD